MVEILRITYYLYEFKRTKQGEVPIYCKLTTDGINRQQFSTRLYIRPEIWDKDAYEKVIATSEEDFAKLAEQVMGEISFDDSEN